MRACVAVLTGVVILCIAVAITVVAQLNTGCYDRGQWYAANETYKPDCNTCHCAGNNISICTKMFCIPAGKAVSDLYGTRAGTVDTGLDVVRKDCEKPVFS
ncbi:hypothetical protein BaRGS_00019532 [Batillaria attramentaria]|uniref:Pacifastin domain-containing protein n=1 Tax=Batillaria attramentaria TaxID=370345 RepID=A0ABD0KRC4_9CAEN